MAKTKQGKRESGSSGSSGENFIKEIKASGNAVIETAFSDLTNFESQFKNLARSLGRDETQIRQDLDALIDNLRQLENMAGDDHKAALARKEYRELAKNFSNKFQELKAKVARLEEEYKQVAGRDHPVSDVEDLIVVISRNDKEKISEQRLFIEHLKDAVEALLSDEHHEIVVKARSVFGVYDFASFFDKFDEFVSRSEADLRKDTAEVKKFLETLKQIEKEIFDLTNEADALIKREIEEEEVKKAKEKKDKEASEAEKAKKGSDKPVVGKLGDPEVMERLKKAQEDREKMDRQQEEDAAQILSDALSGDEGDKVRGVRGYIGAVPNPDFLKVKGIVGKFVSGDDEKKLWFTIFEDCISETRANRNLALKFAADILQKYLLHEKIQTPESVIALVLADVNSPLVKEKSFNKFFKDLLGMNYSEAMASILKNRNAGSTGSPKKNSAGTKDPGAPDSNVGSESQRRDKFKETMRVEKDPATRAEIIIKFAFEKKGPSLAGLENLVRPIAGDQLSKVWFNVVRLCIAMPEHDDLKKFLKDKGVQPYEADDFAISVVEKIMAKVGTVEDKKELIRLADEKLTDGQKDFREEIKGLLNVQEKKSGRYDNLETYKDLQKAIETGGVEKVAAAIVAFEFDGKIVKHPYDIGDILNNFGYAQEFESRRDVWFAVVRYCLNRPKVKPAIDFAKECLSLANFSAGDQVKVKELREFIETSAVDATQKTELLAFFNEKKEKVKTKVVSVVFDKNKNISPKDIPEAEREFHETVEIAGIHGRSDYGGEASKYSDENQDSIFAVVQGKDSVIVGVVDGAGGSGGGLRASQRVTEIVTREVVKGATLEDALKAADLEVDRDNIEQIKKAARNLKNQVEGPLSLDERREIVDDESAYACPVLLKLSKEGKAEMCWSGDAKAMTLRNGAKLVGGTSKMMNLVDEIIRGDKNPDLYDWKSHPVPSKPEDYYEAYLNNKITGHIGGTRVLTDETVPSAVRIESLQFEAKEGDQIVLASDGVWDVVSEFEIEERAKHLKGQDLQKEIFNLAFERNNSKDDFFIQHSATASVKCKPKKRISNHGDNISVVVVDVKKVEEEKKPQADVVDPREKAREDFVVEFQAIAGSDENLVRELQAKLVMNYLISPAKPRYQDIGRQLKLLITDEKERENLYTDIVQACLKSEVNREKFLPFAVELVEKYFFGKGVIEPASFIRYVFLPTPPLLTPTEYDNYFKRILSNMTYDEAHVSIITPKSSGGDRDSLKAGLESLKQVEEQAKKVLEFYLANPGEAQYGIIDRVLDETFAGDQTKKNFIWSKVVEGSLSNHGTERRALLNFAAMILKTYPTQDAIIFALSDIYGASLIEESEFDAIFKPIVGNMTHGEFLARLAALAVILPRRGSRPYDVLRNELSSTSDAKVQAKKILECYLRNPSDDQYNDIFGALREAVNNKIKREEEVWTEVIKICVVQQGAGREAALRLAALSLFEADPEYLRNATKIIFGSPLGKTVTPDEYNRHFKQFLADQEYADAVASVGPRTPSSGPDVLPPPSETPEAKAIREKAEMRAKIEALANGDEFLNNSAFVDSFLGVHTQEELMEQLTERLGDPNFDLDGKLANFGIPAKAETIGDLSLILANGLIDKGIISPEPAPQEQTPEPDRGEPVSDDDLAKARRKMAQAYAAREEGPSLLGRLWNKKEKEAKLEADQAQAWEAYRALQEQKVKHERMGLQRAKEFLNGESKELDALLRNTYKTKENFAAWAWRKLGDANLYNLMEKNLEQVRDARPELLENPEEKTAGWKESLARFWSNNRSSKLVTSVGKICSARTVISAGLLGSTALIGVGAITPAIILAKSAWSGIAGTFGSRQLIDGAADSWEKSLGGRKNVYNTREEYERALESAKMVDSGWIRRQMGKIDAFDLSFRNNIVLETRESLDEKLKIVNETIGNFDSWAMINRKDLDKNADYVKLIGIREQLQAKQLENMAQAVPTAEITRADQASVLQLLDRDLNGKHAELEALLPKIASAKNKRWIARVLSFSVGALSFGLANHFLEAKAQAAEWAKVNEEYWKMRGKMPDGTLEPIPGPSPKPIVPDLHPAGQGGIMDDILKHRHYYETRVGGGILDNANQFQGEYRDKIIAAIMAEQHKPRWLVPGMSKAEIIHRWRVDLVEAHDGRLLPNGEYYKWVLMPKAKMLVTPDYPYLKLDLSDKDLVHEDPGTHMRKALPVSPRVAPAPDDETLKGLKYAQSMEERERFDQQVAEAKVRHMSAEQLASQENLKVANWEKLPLDVRQEAQALAFGLNSRYQELLDSPESEVRDALLLNIGQKAQDLDVMIRSGSASVENIRMMNEQLQEVGKVSSLYHLSAYGPSVSPYPRAAAFEGGLGGGVEPRAPVASVATDASPVPVEPKELFGHPAGDFKEFSGWVNEDRDREIGFTLSGNEMDFNNPDFKEFIGDFAQRHRGDLLSETMKGRFKEELFDWAGERPDSTGLSDEVIPAEKTGIVPTEQPRIAPVVSAQEASQPVSPVDTVSSPSTDVPYVITSNKGGITSQIQYLRPNQDSGAVKLLKDFKPKMIVSGDERFLDLDMKPLKIDRHLVGVIQNRLVDGKNTPVFVVDDEDEAGEALQRVYRFVNNTLEEIPSRSNS